MDTRQEKAGVTVLNKKVDLSMDEDQRQNNKEKHLQEDFLLENVSRHIHVSDCHFRKIFWALTNMTLGEYIKNRRLSEANRALLNGASVTDVAYQYGYQSIDGFTRAFKKWAGILPSQAASLKQGRMVQKLQFVISVKGGTSMKYQIVEKPAFLLQA